MFRVRPSVSVLIAGTVVVASCSGSGEASDPTLSPETSQLADPPPTTAPSDATPRPATTQSAAPADNPPATAEPDVPVGPIIEDMLIDLTDIRVYSTYQRALLPPYDDPRPDADPPSYDTATTPCAYNWTRNWANEDGHYRRLDVQACEFADVAAADAYEADFVENTTDVSQFGDEFVVTKRYEVGDWVGRFGETAASDDGESFRHWNVGRRHGLRFFELTARDQLADSEAEQLLLDMMVAQDELLDTLGIEPDTPGPGFVDLAARLSLDDVLLPWAQIVELGGEDAEDWSSSFEQQLDFLGRTRTVDTGRRRVQFPSGTIWLRALRYVTETDAAGALADVGDAEPIDGITNAFHSAFQSDGFDSAWVITGDRRYEVDLHESVAGNADGLLIERVMAALVEHLDQLGLVTEPVPTPHPIPDDPMLASVPLDALGVLPADWHLSDVDVAIDPLTGAPMVSVSVEQVLGGVFAARRMDADYVVAVDRQQFVDRYVPDVGSLESGEWKQRVDESRSLNGDTGEERIDYRTYFVRHDGEVGSSIWPDNSVAFDRADAERPVEEQFAADMELMLEIGRRLEATMGAAGIDSGRLVGRALWLVDQRQLRTSTADIELFDSFEIPNGFVVLGEPTVDSPTGAVGDWWRPTDFLTGDDPLAARSWLRATLFASPDDAETHLASVVGGDAEPVAGNELGGIVLDDQGGRFATVRGPWCFELMNDSFGRDANELFADENPNVAPDDVLRAASLAWTDLIDRSGLA